MLHDAQAQARTHGGEPVGPHRLRERVLVAEERERKEPGRDGGLCKPEGTEVGLRAENQDAALQVVASLHTSGKPARRQLPGSARGHCDTV